MGRVLVLLIPNLFLRSSAFINSPDFNGDIAQAKPAKYIKKFCLVGMIID